MEIDMTKLLEKQKKLMVVVPHNVSPANVSTSLNAIRVVENLLVFINSLGRKPWRPDPLSTNQILVNRSILRVSVGVLLDNQSDNLKSDVSLEIVKKLTSTLGIIEESIEYFRAVENTSNPITGLEELTDILFFWLEQLAMSGYSLDDINKMYHQKWETNINRYNSAEVGDYSWDDRSKKSGL